MYRGFVLYVGEIETICTDDSVALGVSEPNPKVVFVDLEIESLALTQHRQDGPWRHSYTECGVTA